MPRKTLILISGLVLITVVLFIIALRSSNTPVTTTQQMITQVTQPIPTASLTPMMAHSILSLAPNPVNVLPGGQGKVMVNLDTSDNAVTAVQLELAYDPSIISNVKVTPGALFQNGVILINKNNLKTGRYTFAFGIVPNQPTVRGAGVAASITFTALPNTNGQNSQLTILPTTLVTARGVSPSVLRASSGTTIMIGSTSPGAASGSGGAAGYGGMVAPVGR